MALVLIGVESSADPRAKIQNGGWGIKLMVYATLIVSMFFFVGTESMDDVTSLFQVGACLFILMQVSLLIDGAYKTYAYLAPRMDPEQYGPGWRIIAIGSTLMMYGFTVFVFGVTVAKNYREQEGCVEGIWAVMIGFLLMIVTSCLSIHPVVREATNGEGESNGVFQSAMVSSYASYQVLSALINHPDDRCHLMDINDGSTTVKLLGLLFTFIAVLWSAVRNGSHTEQGASLVGGGTGGFEAEEGQQKAGLC